MVSNQSRPSDLLSLITYFVDYIITDNGTQLFIEQSYALKKNNKVKERKKETEKEKRKIKI